MPIEVTADGTVLVLRESCGGEVDKKMWRECGLFVSCHRKTRAFFMVWYASRIRKERGPRWMLGGLRQLALLSAPDPWLEDELCE